MTETQEVAVVSSTTTADVQALKSTKKRRAFELGEVNAANILQLKVLNTATLPVRYSDKFYRDLLDNYTNKYMKFAFWNGFVVGGICARVENNSEKNYGPDAKDQHGEVDKSDSVVAPKPEGSSRLYIMTMNVLAPYRRQGIAADLLTHVLEKAREDPSIVEAYLHVQVGNEEARSFYLSQGFTQVRLIKDYYKKIDPPDCYMLSKPFPPQPSNDKQQQQQT